MSYVDDIVGLVTGYSKIAIAVMLILTVAIGAGAPMVEQTSSLDQFQSDTPEAAASDYVTNNFSTGPQNTTLSQVIIRGDNVLSKDTLLSTLEYQQRIRDDPEIADTLVDEQPTIGVANVLALGAKQQKLATELRVKGARFEQLNQTVQAEKQALQENATRLQELNQTVQAEKQALQENATRLQELNQTVQAEKQALQENATRLQELNQTVQAERQALQENATAFQQRRDDVNATTARLQQGLTTLAENRSASISAVFERTNADTPVSLDDEDAATFRRAAQQLRNATNETQRQQAYQLGTQGVLEDELTRLQEWGQALDQRRTDLQARAQRLQELAAQVQDQRAALEEKAQRLKELGSQVQDQRAALEEKAQRLKELGSQIQERRGALEEQGQQLKELGSDLKSLKQELEKIPSTPLDEQIDTIESLNATQLDSLIGVVLSGDGGQLSDRALQFMPVKGYEPGSTSAEATMLIVRQTTDSPSVGGTATQTITDSQLAMQDISEEIDHDAEFLVFGSGIISNEINQSMSDSMTIVGPLALVFVLLALAFGYRDLLDIVLGLIGIAAVLVWTFGFMGWLNIDFNQIFIAVPVLLIGLSIDYAIHIFMRHREERYQLEDAGLRGSMRVALGGVGVALALVTATTVIGFLSNLTSPLPPIKDFGVVSSWGIIAAFLIFGVLTPALKVEIDGFLENRGFDRKKRAIGTGGGRLGEVLKIGSIGAKKAPYVILVLALLISAGGVYGATQVDTSFNQADFLAESPPNWMQDLPEPFAPGEYSAKENLNYVNERFQREDSTATILIRGDVAADGALDRLEAGQTAAADKDVTQQLPNGEPSLQTPLTVLRTAATNNETFNQTVASADTDGDGIPDENLGDVYDALFATAPQQAGQVLSRTDSGDYEAARFEISIKGTASGSDTTDQMRAVASTIEGDGLTAIATGQTILFEIVQDQLLDTVIQSLLITLVAVFAFLMVVYRITDGSATLGAVTLVPVVLSVAWILGTMYLMGIPFNVLTGMITSLTVGLGVAYSIHLSERYNQELERNGSAWAALDRSVTGTGGALLGSAATTVGGFGVLAFALLPALQQFGIITGLTIIYAFLASVLVLPSLLVIWTRFVGPAEKLSPDTAGEEPGDSAPTDD